ncbi:MAG: oxygen-independent coproporphyrinogen III oxidase [Massilibacteroides sp.]|nr:oxygen-independent coproporphyrinogen III oxidase [Massilibacteroides sp.]MDD3063067.1 oxygen-independent coproporphyrinogen III oxidase [Massilibacteroides sp.]MDD4114285.1 oxygen-independent coproporphyrinogen III oxidase [Massilibacteroides sp.]MDD4660382.1 oxygen-independent coproporphyrinogen III oxidase [Massilibacteroides sp.]
MRQDLLEKYNVPVPRYTSYPPANFFSTSFTAADYERAIVQSNMASPDHLSFYLHMPFCRRLCHYCGCNAYAMQKPQEVERYIEAVHAEIDLVIKRLDPRRKIAQIHYGGGTPTALPVRFLKELNTHMLSAFDCIERPEIAIECHPGYVDEDYWHELMAAGFNRFSLGIQDFDEAVLKAVNRKSSLLPTERIVEILRSKGASINMDFIYGLPRQTVGRFAETIRQAISLGPDRLVTFSYAHIPGIYPRQLFLEKIGLPTSDEKSRMYETACDLLASAGYERIGLDHFVKPEDELFRALSDGRLHRNFQGYCTRRTTGQVYAFGVTGISQLAEAYAQNTKSIPEYIERVEKGQLPVIKGYALRKDEQVTREVIETLMCNYRIDWFELKERFCRPLSELRRTVGYEDSVMAAFARDGLITYDDRFLTITPAGRLFVRNVAASMDPLMKNSDKIFSKPV